MGKQVGSAPADVVNWALRLEAGVGLIAILLGTAIGYSPLASLERAGGQQTAWAVLWGVVATGPLLGLLWLGDRFPVGPLRALRETMDQKVIPLFQPATVGQLGLIALAAGWGEELLFRGVLQPLAGDGLGWWGGLLVASVLFGLCHWVSTAYAVFATVVGLYLGGLLLLTGHLLAPIVTHGLYDFLALVYLLRWRAAVDRSA